MVWKSDMFTFSFLVNWQVGKIQELEKKKKICLFLYQWSSLKAPWKESHSYTIHSL